MLLRALFYTNISQLKTRPRLVAGSSIPESPRRCQPDQPERPIDMFDPTDSEIAALRPSPICATG